MKPTDLIAGIVAGTLPPKETRVTSEMVGSALELGLSTQHAENLLMKHDNLTPGAKGRLEQYIRNHAEQA